MPHRICTTDTSCNPASAIFLDSSEKQKSTARCLLSIQARISKRGGEATTRRWSSSWRMLAEASCPRKSEKNTSSAVQLDILFGADWLLLRLGGIASTVVKDQHCRDPPESTAGARLHDLPRIFETRAGEAMTLRVQLLSVANTMLSTTLAANFCRPSCSFGTERNLGCALKRSPRIWDGIAATAEPDSAPEARRGRGRPGGWRCQAAAECEEHRRDGKTCTQFLRRLARRNKSGSPALAVSLTASARKRPHWASSRAEYPMLRRAKRSTVSGGTSTGWHCSEKKKP